MAAAPLALGARERSAYAVLGSQLFIFGGLDAQGNALNSGAIYDKPTDSWTMLPQSANVPSPRQQATAIVTVGGRVFVLGGSDAASTLAYGDDARYDSSTNSWVALQPLLTGCVSPWALSTVNYVMLWGGLSASNAPLLGGQRYTYNSGGTAGPSWTIVNTSSATPERVSEASFATASDSAFAFGGKVNGTTKTNHGFIYSFATNAWAAIGTGPSARWGAFAVSDGTVYFLWGGRDETTVMNSGYVYSNGWTTLGSTGVASARWAPYRRTGWAFAFAAGDIAIVGGMDLAGGVLMDGARYIRATDSWTPILPWPSQEAHEYGVAAVIDGEIFLWGGRDGTTVTATGERYKP
jgi:N-acetylneuraminic acid mutarotase